MRKVILIVALALVFGPLIYYFYTTNFGEDSWRCPADPYEVKEIETFKGTYSLQLKGAYCGEEALAYMSSLDGEYKWTEEDISEGRN